MKKGSTQPGAAPALDPGGWPLVDTLAGPPLDLLEGLPQLDLTEGPQLDLLANFPAVDLNAENGQGRPIFARLDNSSTRSRNALQAAARGRTARRRKESEKPEAQRETPAAFVETNKPL